MQINKTIKTMDKNKQNFNKTPDSNLLWTRLYLDIGQRLFLLYSFIYF